ncbi:hypothetical protein Agub_g11053 [Astrephomene gubernaculifera]|uniref:Reticulon-like protein n=1 Tax=Astrephomene gubernaculifera TaxID=47775 RepID=A0AAD3DVZ3_9CHLO|nr:hypothetical protein Agub_g11053 [Astrephomene gubernaculifera]
MTHAVHLPFVSKKVEDLALWRDVKSSGAVFGGATAAYLAFLLNPFPAVTIVCYLVAIASLAAFLWSQMGHLVGRSGPPVPALMLRGLTEEEARNIAYEMLPVVNRALATVGVLASGKDLKMSLLVACGSYAAARIFAVISPVTLAYLVLLLGFTLPKAYEAKQSEVDRAVATARAKMDETAAKLHEVVGRIPKASPAKKTE